VDTFRSFVELAPDVRLRIEHITVSADGSLALVTFSGTHEGGEFEDVRIVVHEYDRSGQICRHDIYNPEQLGDAWARFAELASQQRNPQPPLPASRLSMFSRARVPPFEKGAALPTYCPDGRQPSVAAGLQPASDTPVLAGLQSASDTGRRKDTQAEDLRLQLR